MLKLFLYCALFAGIYAFNHGSDLADFEAFRVSSEVANTAKG